MSRPIHEIAREIEADIDAGNWSELASFYAKPYLAAMTVLPTINHNYGLDSGKSVVLYFLANAGTWKGETARRIKAELKELVK